MERMREAWMGKPQSENERMLQEVGEQALEALRKMQALQRIASA